MASQKLRWYSSSGATVALFIAHGHADAELAEACLMRLTMLMLLAIVGRGVTVHSPLHSVQMHTLCTCLMPRICYALAAHT